MTYCIPMEVVALSVEAEYSGRRRDLRIPGRYLRAFETREEAEKYAPDIKIMEVEVVKQGEE